MEQDDLTKKQGRRLTVFACLLSLVSIGLLVFGFKVVSSDKVILLQSLSNLTNKLDVALDNNSLLLNKLASSSDVGFKGNVNIKEGEDTTNISIDYLENKADSKSLLEVLLLSNGDSLLDTSLALQDSKIYTYIEDITPSYYSYPLEYSSFFSNLTNNDYDKLISIFKETLTDYIENDDIRKEKVTISYQGKDKSVNKLTYTIDSKVVEKIANNYFEAVKKDRKLISTLASNFNLTDTELEDKIEGFLESISLTEEDTIYYSIYYYGFNKIVQYEIYDEADSKILYKIDSGDLIEVYAEGDLVTSLNVTKKKNQYDFTLVLLTDGEETEIKGIVDGNTLNATILGEKGRIEVIASIQDEADYKYQGKIEYNIITDQDSSSTVIDFDLSYYFDQKITNSITSSIDINEMTEEDLAIIEENLSNHPLASLISSLINYFTSEEV